MAPIAIVAYLVLFATVGLLFLLVALFVGRLLRANVPTREKLEPYECGEPAVGSSFVQFDLRFYVVALVFLVFEVEVALFFPPAAIFGKATQLMGPQAHQTSWAVAEELGMKPLAGAKGTVPFSSDENWDSPRPVRSLAPAEAAADARTLALASMADLGVFFAVILLGFAYVWWRGDLDWVRAIGTPGLKIQATVGWAPPTGFTDQR